MGQDPWFRNLRVRLESFRCFGPELAERAETSGLLASETVRQRSAALRSADVDTYAREVLDPLRASTRPGARKIIAELAEHGADPIEIDMGPLYAGVFRLEPGREVGILAQNRQVGGGIWFPEHHAQAIDFVRYIAGRGLCLVTFMDTPGADAGAESNRGRQCHLISRLISEMLSMKVPTVGVVLGYACSGGAIPLATTHVLLSVADGIFCTIHPYGFSVIVRREDMSWQQCAMHVGVSAYELYLDGVIDGVIDSRLSSRTLPSRPIQVAILAALGAVEKRHGDGSGNRDLLRLSGCKRLLLSGTRKRSAPSGLERSTGAQAVARKARRPVPEKEDSGHRLMEEVRRLRRKHPIGPEQIVRRFFEEFHWRNEDLQAADPLMFPGFYQTMEEAKNEGVSPCAIRTGIGKFHFEDGSGVEIGAVLSNSAFHAGSFDIGSFEKMAALLDECVRKKLPAVCFVCTGGIQNREGAGALFIMPFLNDLATSFVQDHGLTLVCFGFGFCIGGVQASLLTSPDVHTFYCSGTEVAFSGQVVVPEYLPVDSILSNYLWRLDGSMEGLVTNPFIDDLDQRMRLFDPELPIGNISVEEALRLALIKGKPRISERPLRVRAAGKRIRGRHSLPSRFRRRNEP